MLSLKMNDSAVKLLDATAEPASLALTAGLSPGLAERLANGIVRRGDVLAWADSRATTVAPPSIFKDLTAWECANTSFHIEDFVPVAVAIVDHAPVISEDDQRTLLRHGVTFALRFSRFVYDLDPPAAVRCIVGANETNSTFRFHQIRPGESWNRPDLDDYRQESVITLDIEPAMAR